jgi:hypothetical protein
MRTREIIVISLFIITVCVVSIIPFSDNKQEGFNLPGTQVPEVTTTPQATTSIPTTTPQLTTSMQTTTPQATTSMQTTTPQATTSIPTTTTPQATTSISTTTPKATTSIPTTTTPQATTTKPFTKITNNKEYLDATVNALSSDPNPTNDKIAIYKIQGLISSIKSQNAATLLGEIGNPNNLTDPRLFLQYMNWFGSNCPIDSDVCTGLSC